MARQIQRAREDVGLSKKRFAAAVGVGRRAPIRWEKGEVMPQADNLARIAAVTGKDIAFFFTEEDEEESELAALHAEVEALQALRAHEDNITDALLRRIDRLVDEERRVTT